MDRIVHSTAVDIGGGRRGFRSKDTVAGLPGTVVTATHLNAEQEELMAVIEKSGLAPDSADLAQLAEAVRSQHLNYDAAVGGTANALTVTLDPVQTVHKPGLILRLVPSATNTGPVTFDEGGGTLPLRYVMNEELLPGEVIAGHPIEILCLGDRWALLNPVLYFTRQTPVGQQAVSAFTAGTVIADMSNVNQDYVTQSLSVTGVTYIDAYGVNSIMNGSATLCGFTTRLKLVGGTDGAYVGATAKDSLQVPMTVQGRWSGLDRAATYTLQLLSRKTQPIGPMSVLDARITAYCG